MCLRGLVPRASDGLIASPSAMFSKLFTSHFSASPDPFLTFSACLATYSLVCLLCVYGASGLDLGKSQKEGREDQGRPR